MPRPSKPWFRTATGWWMVKLGGKQHKLAKGRKNKKAATAKFHELMAAQAQLPESPDARVVDICEAFLEFSAKHHAPDTYRNHRFYLQSFCEAAGLLPVAELRPFHVTRWCESKPWNETSQFNARRYAFRAMNWAVSEGLLGRNPLQGMKRPKPRPRQRALTEEEYRAMIRASDGRFRLFLFVLRQTGARPKEVRDLKWTDVREDRWVLWKHKTDRTLRPRVIHLNQPMQKLMHVLRKRSESDYVFTNSRGRPWTTNAVRLRIQRLKKKLGLADDVCAYLFRHAFGTRAVLNGVDVATVAELMGHRSTEMISTVYLHLADQESHLQEAVRRATQGPLGVENHPDR